MNVYDEISAIIDEPARLSDLVAAADRLNASAASLDPTGMKKVLAKLRDDGPANVEVLDTILGRFEVDPGWVAVLAQSAEGLAIRAPSTLRLRLARLLNDSRRQAELLALLPSLEASCQKALLDSAEEIAKKPAARPGGSARAFLEQARK